MKFRKLPIVVEAISFDQLVAHGLTQVRATANGMPWSFSYAGHPITHENDDCYLIPTLEGTMNMGRSDVLVTGVNGEIYPVKMEIFAKTYEVEMAGTHRPTGIEAEVCADIARRQAHGVAKYGTTVADNPLPLRAWLQHAYEESLDHAVYLKRAMAEIDAMANEKDQAVDRMVTRFLGWRLPATFSPDGGVSFDRTGKDPDTHWWPVGTNVLNADEARQMVEHISSPSDS